MHKYTISYACTIHVGSVREENQDNFYIDGRIAGDENETFASRLKYEKNIIAVCDGLGGEANGKKAAWLVAKRVKQAAEVVKKDETIDVHEVIINHLTLANNDVHEMSDKLEGMGGSTVNIVCIDGERILSYNLGDSRTYLYRKGVLTQLSRDHTSGRNLLDKCIGMPPIHSPLREPHIIDESVHADDILLLCSDGLTDMCSISEITSVLSSEKNLERAIQTLLELALQNGGEDNIAIILLHFDADR
jgi:protein phosphatase